MDNKPHQFHYNSCMKSDLGAMATRAWVVRAAVISTVLGVVSCKPAPPVAGGPTTHTQALAKVTLLVDMSRQDVTQFNGPIASPDGRHVAFTHETMGDSYVLLDNKKGAVYDMIWDEPTFSPDGSHLAYSASRGKKFSVVVDGVEGKSYEGVGSLAYSPDGKRFAYVAQLSQKSCVVVDGVEGPKLPGFVLQPTFSADSKRLAYFAEGGVGGSLIVDGVQMHENDTFHMWNPTFSPDGTRLAYKCSIVKGGIRAALKSGKFPEVVVVDGKPGEEYKKIGGHETWPPMAVAHWSDSMDGPIFSVDSKHYAYVGRQERFEVIVRDGIEGPPYDQVWSPTFGDGGRFGYVAVRSGKWFPVVDGKEGPRTDGISIFKFSPDGKHIAWVAKAANRISLYLDDVRVATADSITAMAFSPDGKRIAFWSFDGDSATLSVIQGANRLYKSGPFTFLAIGGGPSFVSNDRAVAVAGWDNKVFRIDVTLNGKR